MLQCLTKHAKSVCLQRAFLTLQATFRNAAVQNQSFGLVRARSGSPASYQLIRVAAKGTRNRTSPLVIAPQKLSRSPFCKSDFSLRAHAAREMRHSRRVRCCLAAQRAVIHAGHSEDPASNSQVAGLSPARHGKGMGYGKEDQPMHWRRPSCGAGHVYMPRDAARNVHQPTMKWKKTRAKTPMATISLSSIRLITAA